MYATLLSLDSNTKTMPILSELVPTLQQSVDKALRERCATSPIALDPFHFPLPIVLMVVPNPSAATQGTSGPSVKTTDSDSTIGGASPPYDPPVAPGEKLVAGRRGEGNIYGLTPATQHQTGERISFSKKMAAYGDWYNELAGIEDVEMPWEVDMNRRFEEIDRQAWQDEQDDLIHQEYEAQRWQTPSPTVPDFVEQEIQQSVNPPIRELTNAHTAAMEAERFASEQYQKWLHCYERTDPQYGKKEWRQDGVRRVEWWVWDPHNNVRPPAVDPDNSDWDYSKRQYYLRRAQEWKDIATEHKNHARYLWRQLEPLYQQQY